MDAATAALPATDKQVQYVKDLFRKVKLYYQYQDDDALAAAVLERTGYDIKNLTRKTAQEVIDYLKPEKERQRGGVYSKWGKRYGR